MRRVKARGVSSVAGRFLGRMFGSLEVETVGAGFDLVTGRALAREVGGRS